MPALNPCQSDRLTRCWVALICLLLILINAGVSSCADPQNHTQNGSKPMHMTHVCLITPKLKHMEDFYRQVLQMEPKRFQEDYLEFQTPGAIISLYRQESFQKIAPKATLQPGTGGMMLELQVADVDREYTRLQGLPLGIDFILPPTTFPWGNRSIYLKDPDGNFLNIYSLVPAP